MKSKEAESNDRRNNYDDATPEELKDPMSGYASADALASDAERLDLGSGDVQHQTATALAGAHLGRDGAAEF